MSEFTNHQDARTKKLLDLFQLVIHEELTHEQVAKYKQTIDATIPADIIRVVDQLVQMKIPMAELKKGINKALNLLNKTLTEIPFQVPERGSFLYTLVQNNEQVDLQLKAIRPLLKDLNKNTNYPYNELEFKLITLSHIDLHYQIKENVLFPLIEKYMPDFRCLQVMWSFHDDIRRNLKEAIRILNPADFELKKFNRLIGDISFQIYAIKFREERILFPVISELIPENILNSLISESIEIGYPFIQPEPILREKRLEENQFPGQIDLKTGHLTIEQILLIFNHLPIDITYVDENNQVKFFSTPEKRIFRRTNSIIGRDVKNCHPHESVHVVEQIVDAFKKGEKDNASFWIKMKGEMILIQYFAVRDEKGNYRGVIEVTQEITNIQNIEGEKRLLDWTN
jgi:uncharacterized protein